MSDTDLDSTSTPAANQIRTDPVPSAPEESPQASGDVDPARAIKPDADSARRQDSGDSSSLAGAGVPLSGATAGDVGNAPAPSVLASASDEASPGQAVRTTAVAAPGKPDGEVDTRA